ncbi:hypothetical protein MTO96_017067 [Rhipicephalus appendiculatus]
MPARAGPATLLNVPGAALNLSETDCLAKLAAERARAALNLSETYCLAKLAAERARAALNLSETDCLAKLAAERARAALNLSETDRLAKLAAERARAALNLSETDCLAKLAAERARAALNLSETDCLAKLAAERARAALNLSETDRLAKLAAECARAALNLSETDRLAKLAAECAWAALNLSETDCLAKLAAERAREQAHELAQQPVLAAVPGVRHAKKRAMTLLKAVVHEDFLTRCLLRTGRGESRPWRRKNTKKQAPPNAATYSSMDSPGCWVRQRKRWRSTTLLAEAKCCVNAATAWSNDDGAAANFLTSSVSVAVKLGGGGGRFWRRGVAA